MAEPIVNPELPYVGEIPSHLLPGKMIRFQGVTLPDSDRFNINLATGPNSKPRDDTALHISVRLSQGYIARNSYKNGTWGDEQGKGKLPISQAEHFELMILVDKHDYKIAVNGQHFCEFPHRIPYDDITHLLIDGDVSLTLISYERITLPGDETSSRYSQVNAEGPQGGPQYGPPPPNYGGYGPPPQQQKSEFSSFFDQAQGILAGAIASGAAEKIMGSIFPSGQPQQPQGYAPQNAQYGIYPQLPPQDTTSHNPQDTTLSNLIAGSGGTITQGPQPSAPPPYSDRHSDDGPGLFENILGSFLGGNHGGASQGHNSQSADILSGLFSNLMSGQSGGPHQSSPPPQQQSDVLSGILSSLLTPDQKQQHNLDNPQGQENLSGILSNLIAPNHNQGPAQPVSPQSSDTLQNILQSLVTNLQQGQTSPQTESVGGKIDIQQIISLLQGLLLKVQTHNSTRPIQETNPGGGFPQQQPDGQQYGQYPSAPQHQDKGPMDSLLSGLLSGGGGQQQNRGNQGGDIGGVLGSLAGSFFNRSNH